MADASIATRRTVDSASEAKGKVISVGSAEESTGKFKFDVPLHS